MWDHILLCPRMSTKLSVPLSVPPAGVQYMARWLHFERTTIRGRTCSVLGIGKLGVVALENQPVSEVQSREIGEHVRPCCFPTRAGCN